MHVARHCHLHEGAGYTVLTHVCVWGGSGLRKGRVDVCTACLQFAGLTGCTRARIKSSELYCRPTLPAPHGPARHLTIAQEAYHGRLFQVLAWCVLPWVIVLHQGFQLNLDGLLWREGGAGHDLGLIVGPDVLQGSGGIPITAAQRKG